MAFQPLPAPARPFSNRNRNHNPNPTAFISAKSKYPQVTFSIPRHLMREAGLADYPGAKVDILVGTGADLGSIAIIDGPTHTIGRMGRQKTASRVLVRSSRLCRPVTYPARNLTYEIGRGQLILTLPADFPWAAGIGRGAAIAQPEYAASSRELGAAA